MTIAALPLIWSNTAAAHLDLPPALQKLADELWAVHSNACDYAVKSRATEADKKHFDEVFTGTIYKTEHPVVRVHPETGERTLVLGNFVQRFVGLPKYDGQKLFRSRCSLAVPSVVYTRRPSPLSRTPLACVCVQTTQSGGQMVTTRRAVL